MKQRAKSTNRVKDIRKSVEEMPLELSIYVDKFMALANYISKFKKSKDYKQKQIAASLSKTEAEISKWLSGVHNLTLQSILKLEAACSIQLLNPAIFETEKKAVSYSFDQINIPVPNQKDFGDLQYLNWYLNKSSGCQATEFTTEGTLETKDINTLLSY